MNKQLGSRRVGAVSVVAGLCMTSLSACGVGGGAANGGDCLTEIEERGTLRVGTVSNLPIDAIDSDTGEMIGFNADLLNAFIDETGIADDVTPTPLPFDSLVPSLAADKIDITSDTMFKTAERDAQIDFTTHIFYNPEGLLVQEGNPKGLTQLSDFGEGTSIGTYQGTVWVDWVSQMQADQGVQMRVLPGVSQLTEGIAAGQVDSGLMSSAIAAYMIREKPDIGIELAEGYEPRSREEVATHLGIQQGCTDLQEEFNTWFTDYARDGRMEKNLKKWGVEPVATYLEGVDGYGAEQ